MRLAGTLRPHARALWTRAAGGASLGLRAGAPPALTRAPSRGLFWGKPGGGDKNGAGGGDDGDGKGDKDDKDGGGGGDEQVRAVAWARAQRACTLVCRATSTPKRRPANVPR